MAAKLPTLTQNVVVLQHLVTESYRVFLAAVDPKCEFGNFCECLVQLTAGAQLTPLVQCKKKQSWSNFAQLKLMNK
jgi:hypothetical protein